MVCFSFLFSFYSAFHIRLCVSFEGKLFFHLFFPSCIKHIFMCWENPLSRRFYWYRKEEKIQQKLCFTQQTFGDFFLSTEHIFIVVSRWKKCIFCFKAIQTIEFLRFWMKMFGEFEIFFVFLGFSLVNNLSDGFIYPQFGRFSVWKSEFFNCCKMLHSIVFLMKITGCWKCFVARGNYVEFFEWIKFKRDYCSIFTRKIIEVLTWIKFDIKAIYR